MDTQKVKALTNATKGSFSSFVGLRSFLIMGDAMFHIMTLFYKNIQENILNPLFDPYVPKNFLIFRINDKVTLNIGKFLVEFSKTAILAFLTFQIFIWTEPYFNSFVKRKGG